MSVPFRSLRNVHRPTDLAGWAFLNCMRSGCARVWLALAADREDSVFYEDAQLS